METKKFEFETPKEIAEIGEAIKNILIATDAALKDGFQAGQDLPAIITVCFANLVSAIGGIQNLPEEFRTNPTMSVMGLLVPISQGVETVIKNHQKV